MREKDISFHESTINQIAVHTKTVNLELEDVTYKSRKVKGVLKLTNVTQVATDQIPVHSLRMEREDGEILDLSRMGNKVLLIVEWNDFKKKALTMSYEIDCDGMEFTPENTTPQ